MNQSVASITSAASIAAVLVTQVAVANPTPTPRPKTQQATPAVHSGRKPPTARVMGNTYECPECREKFTGAEAKRIGMKCSCCNVSLVPVKTASKSPAPQKN